MALVDFSFLFKPSPPILPLFSFWSCCPPSLQLHLSYSLLPKYTVVHLIFALSTALHLSLHPSSHRNRTLCFFDHHPRRRAQSQNPIQLPHVFPQKSTLSGSQHLRPLQCLTSHQRTSRRLLSQRCDRLGSSTFHHGRAPQQPKLRRSQPFQNLP